ncbi:hypothetical protein PFISCL1PPCAC_26539, partial [Pristionchus fissidentatus]
DDVIENENSVSCPNGHNLFVGTTTAPVTVPGAITCVDGMWTGELQDGSSFYQESITVTCDAPCPVPNKEMEICLATGVCDSTSTSLDANPATIKCTQGQLLVSESSSVGSGVISPDGLTCVAGVWKGTVGSNTNYESTNVHVTCMAVCELAIGDDQVCPDELFCDSSLLDKTTMQTKCTSGTMYISPSETDGVAVELATCVTGGLWAASPTTIDFASVTLHASCTRTLTEGCSNPIKWNEVCPPNLICKEDFVDIDGGVLKCTNTNGKLYVASSIPSYGKYAPNGLTCVGSSWSGVLGDGAAFDSATAYVTCEQPDETSGTDCNSCVPVPFAEPSEELFTEAQLYEFKNIEKAVEDEFSCNSLKCTPPNRLYFGTTAHVVQQQNPICKANGEWDAMPGLPWTNVTLGAYCATLKCPLLKNFVDCHDQKVGCNGDVAWSADEYLRCKMSGSPMVVADETQTTFFTTTDQFLCDLSTGTWFDEQRKIAFKPAFYQCKYGCANPEKSTRVCPAGTTCDPSNTRYESNSFFDCKGKTIYTSEVNVNSAPAMTTQPYTCTPFTGEWTTNGLNGGELHSFTGKFFFNCGK